MPFRFSFTGPSPAAVERARAVPVEPLEDPEDYWYLAVRACGVLADTDALFRIGGFGTEDWSFDLGYDMSAFVEGLPHLIEALRAGSEAEIDLYPQGVERTLRFSPVGDQVRITCVSRTSWVPRPGIEVCGLDELLGMCARLAQDFSEALSAVAPAIAQSAVPTLTAAAGVTERIRRRGAAH
ncbi:hypothetical protein [Streptomyces sp. NBC_01190]|uniref:hypothetical protein n=1 Tax=Streptomyces sp. NBC_01190 TaxID=2903767 RepID=UPI00386A4A92|nr:hypothetical protein OG519_16540 [Streptomyces sp. NBC_01190]